MNIWVNGCFDIIHTGHIDLLWYAKLFKTEGLTREEAMKANHLYVGLDTDERVKYLKGDKRPINSINTRVKIMSNLKMVDSVAVFNSAEELEYFIQVFNIDYLIIGDQYKTIKVIGAQYAKEGVEYYPVDSRSTTNIIDKIKKEAKLEVYTEIYEKNKDSNDTISINFNNFAVGKIRELEK